MGKTEKPKNCELKILDCSLDVPAEVLDKFLERLKKENPAGKVRIVNACWSDGEHKIVRFTVEY